ncbi:unnamed protein product [Caenorhabditis nigoni]
MNEWVPEKRPSPSTKLNAVIGTTTIIQCRSVVIVALVVKRTGGALCHRNSCFYQRSSYHTVFSINDQLATGDPLCLLVTDGLLFQRFSIH